jgi:hypothetical protein
VCATKLRERSEVHISKPNRSATDELQTNPNCNPIKRLAGCLRTVFQNSAGLPNDAPAMEGCASLFASIAGWSIWNRGCLTARPLIWRG